MRTTKAGRPPARRAAVLFLTVAIAGIVYAATLRSGQDWGGDFAMYIMHARNIAEGIPYGQTGYIINPSVPSLGPRTYPPVYPMLLSPIYRFFGMDFRAMKLELVVMFALFLGVLCVAFGRNRAPGFSVALVLFVAANPLFWEFKDHIRSDIPFLLFSYAALAAIDRGVDRGGAAGGRAGEGLVAGALVYLAYGTRLVGIVILPCLVLLDLLRHRRLTVFSLAALLAFVPLAAAQTGLMAPDRAYTSQISIAPSTAATNLVMHVRSLSLVFDNGYVQAPRLALFALLACLAVTGYVARLRTRITVWEIFAPAYLATLLLWTARADRFVFPLIPLLAVYALEGLSLVLQGRPRTVRIAAISSAAIVVLAGYASRYTTLDLIRFEDGVHTAEARTLFDFITSSTDPADVIVFRKPRVMTLFTDRRAAVFHEPESDAAMWAFLDGIDAAFLVVSEEDPPYWAGFVERQRDRLERVFGTPRFAVYATEHARRRATGGGL